MTVEQKQSRVDPKTFDRGAIIPHDPVLADCLLLCGSSVFRRLMRDFFSAYEFENLA